jgi:hypothetical protein
MCNVFGKIRSNVFVLRLLQVNRNRRSLNKRVPSMTSPLREFLSGERYSRTVPFGGFDGSNACGADSRYENDLRRGDSRRGVSAEGFRSGASANCD